MNKYAKNVYSQNGEDGIIAEAIRRINPSYKVATEFGAHDGSFCSNTKALHALGWERHLFDINVEGETSGIVEKEITPENVNDLPPCSVLSIDIDGNDYNVWMAYKGQPDIVVIEINSSLPPMEPHFTLQQGSSYITMKKLGEAKGYFLLCHTGNMIFVLNNHKELFPDADETFKTDWL